MWKGRTSELYQKKKKIKKKHCFIVRRLSRQLARLGAKKKKIRKKRKKLNKLSDSDEPLFILFYTLSIDLPA